MEAQNASLAQLFASARLSVQLPASASSNPQTIFFDELLKVDIQLSLPSHQDLPVSDQPEYEVPLPLSLADQLVVPPLLRTFLACLHVSLLTDYVPPSDPSATGHKSANPHIPFSSVNKQHADFQLLPEASGQQTASSVRSFAASWSGVQRSDGPLSTLYSPNSSASDREQSNYTASLRQENSAWVIQWKCPVPINFIATPFEPLLSVTAALTLRLDPVHLRTADTDPHLRSGFSHSLLTPLHEGPIYPDESRSQSVARASAASALGLDGPHGLGSYLADLPKDVMGGTSAIVTPKTGILALRAILQRNQDALAAQSAAASTTGASSKAVESNGDLAAAVQSLSLAESERAEKESESTALRVYKRSTREVVALKTGLNVRMRTLYTTHDPFASASSTDLSMGLEDSAPASLGSTSLVLCVELENPFDSGIVFTVSDIKIRIHPPSAASTQPFQLHAKLLSYKSEDRFPIQLSQGQQHNLLYYLSSSADSTAPVSLPSDTGNTVRNVTILVSGCPRPLDFLSAEPTQIYQGSAIHAGESSNDFESQWNCSLDVRPLLANAATPHTRTSTQARTSAITAI